MEQLRIKKVIEAEFDRLVEKAGGERIDEEGSADYLFHEAVMDLKLLEEEGLAKDERRKKIATIFQRTQHGAPTVLVDHLARD